MRPNKKILALLGMGHAITDVNQGALPVILTFLPYLTQLKVGVVMLAFNVSSSVIQPLFGIMSDRFKAPWLIPLGCLLAGFGMASTGFTNSYFMLLLAVLISGLGVAAYHPEGSKFARFASGERKASGMSLFSVGGNIGFAIGPILASFFCKAFGLYGTLGFLLINATMALFLLSFLPRIKGLQPSDAKISSGKKSKDPRVLINSRKVLFSVILLLFIIIMRSWTHLGIVTFLPQYYVRSLHYGHTYAAGAVSLFLFAGAIGTLVGGPLADRWGLKRVIVLSMLTLIPLCFLLPYLREEWLLLVVGLSGFAVIATFSVTVVFGQELLPHHVGLASGLTLGFGIGMGGVGTTLLGWIADHFGLQTALHTLVLFPTIGFILSLFLPQVGQTR